MECISSSKIRRLLHLIVGCTNLIKLIYIPVFNLWKVEILSLSLELEYGKTDYKVTSTYFPIKVFICYKYPIISSKYVENFHKNALTFYCVKRICWTQKILFFITFAAKNHAHIYEFHNINLLLYGCIKL